MKNKFLMATLSLCLTWTAWTQTPDQWSAFVFSAANTEVKDTFRFQGFEGSPRDNWSYVPGDLCTLFDCRIAGITGQQGNCSLQIPLGQTVDFEKTDVGSYASPQLTVYYGGKNLLKGENLNFNIYRIGNSVMETITRPVMTTSTPLSFNYGEKINTAPNPIIIGKVSRLQIQAAVPGEGSAGGFYCIDSVFMQGLIPLYSLFSGQGEWNDTILWSHYPAARNRIALINGDVSVDRDSYCRSVVIGPGTLTISPGSTLRLQEDLTLYDGTGGMQSHGQVQIPGKVVVHKTFPQKGHWYFVSFPFDVYTTGISFTIGNEQPNEGGNYLYIKQYDARRRAETGKDTDNWTTLSPGNIAPDAPLLRKNQGYLLAIDREATQTAVAFSSAEGAAPASFGKNGLLSAEVYMHSHNPASPHSGWYLCSNPLPSPLSVDLLPRNSTMGNFLYVYDGTTYQVYETGGEEKIPPFGAFFIKATDDVQQEVGLIQNRSLPLFSPAETPELSICLRQADCTDRTKIRFLPQATAFADRLYDAYKLSSIRSEVPQLASRTQEGQLLAVNTQQATDRMDIPLCIRTGNAGTCTLYIQQIRQLEAYRIVLTDRQTRQCMVLAPGLSYTFSTTKTAYSDRFLLSFHKKTPTACDMLSTTATCYATGRSLFIQGLQEATKVYIFDFSGKQVGAYTVPAGDTEMPLPFAPGHYLVRLDAPTHMHSIKITISR